MEFIVARDHGFSIMTSTFGAFMKTCKVCNEIKSIDFFAQKNQKNRKPSHQSVCKSCKAKAARDARAKNPEAIRAYERDLRAARTEAQKQRQAEYLVEWRANNKEKIKSYRPTDVVRKYSRAYYEKHKEKVKLSVSIYRKSNLQKIRALNQSRRGLQRTGKLSPNIVEVLFQRQNGLCVCCLNKLNDDFHLDHIIPLSMGGTNTDDNVQLLKSKCNLQKNAKHPVDFMRERGYLL